MSGLYENIVLERVRHPRHAGKPAHFDALGNGSNALCGDKVDIYLTREGMVLHHESQGCAIMSASADLMADAARGKNAGQIRELARYFAHSVTTGEQNAALGELNALTTLSEFPSRIGCATLPWRALEEALQNV